MRRAVVICDFCSSPAPAWCYPAATFDGPFHTRSVQDWLACEECHRLIEAGDRTGLARRAVLNPAVRQHGIDPAFARRYARELHDGFFEHRRGAAHRIKV
jgi:hypothetical protein